MNVRQLIAELSLHPPDTPVLVRADPYGFNTSLVVEPVVVRPAEPPIPGISHVAAGDQRKAGDLKAICVGPPDDI